LDYHDQIESSDRKLDAKEIEERIQQLRDRREKYESYQRKLKQSGDNEISTTDEVLADKGYYQAKDLKKCAENGITVYITKQTYANGTKDQAFYSDRFKYDPERKVYICPGGKSFIMSGREKKDGKVIGYEYRDDTACKKCEFKARCTSAKKGRSICRHVD
jgi:hypothetical protein